MSLSENAEKLLEILQTRPATTKQLAKKLGLQERTISIRLQELKKAGYGVINKDGKYTIPVSIDSVVQQFDYDLPASTYDEPFEIKTKDPKGFKLAFANTIYAGGKTNQSLVKNLLKYCEADKVDGLVLTGNTLWMDLTKFSKYKPDRAQSSEFVPNPEDIGYSDYLKSLGEGPAELMATKKPVFITFKERFDMIVNHSLAPLFLDEKKKPLYDGPVYVIFGQIEEDLARQHANDLVRRETFKARESLNSMITDLKDEIKDNETQQKELEKSIGTYIKDLKKEFKELPEPEEEKNEKMSLDDYITEDKGLQELREKTTKQIAKLEERNAEAKTNMASLEHDKARITMTNVDEQFVNLAFLAMKSYIREKIEEVIPNCKVISTGDGYIKASNEIIKVVYSADKLGDRVSDNLMDKLVEKTRENLPLGERPTLIVAGGLSSVYTQVPVAYVDTTKEGKKISKTINLIQLPTCLDDTCLEGLLKGKVRASGNNMLKLASKNDFHAGALVVEQHDGLQKRKLLTTHYLSNNEAFKNPAKIISHEMFFEANFSDQHHGSKYVSIVETKEDIQYLFEVAQQFLVDIGAPIVKITSLGDEVQAKNYDTSGEDHKDNLTPMQLEQKIEKIYTTIKDPEQAKIEVKKLAKKSKIRSGIDMPQDQKEDFLEAMDYGFLKHVLENYRAAKLTGPMMYIIEGNHSEHTFEGLIKLSRDMVREITLRIGANKKEVTAPMFDKMGLDIANFGIEGHYQYGEYARHKQGGAKNSKDPTRATRIAFTKRGQDFEKLIGRFTFNRAGHTHMGGQTASRNVFHDIGYCFMDRNAYGEAGNFGSAARGFKINGIPVDGPTAGPIITIDVPVEYLTKWANEKPKIDVEKLFENSIIKPKK